MKLKKPIQTNRSEAIKRLVITIIFISIFRFGASITLPGAIPNILIPYVQNNTALSLINTLSGSGLTQMSLFALGVSPYITASIIIQVLQTFKKSKLHQIAKHGHIGQIKINKITRKTTLIIGAIQGLMLTLGGVQLTSEKQSVQHIIFFTILLTGGTMFAIWISDQITEYGLGNGISLIIATGILAQIPADIQTYTSLIGDITKQNIWIFISVTAFTLILLSIVVFIHLSEYRIPILSATQTNQKTSKMYLPIKLNPAGINPTLFASAIVTIPSLIVSGFNIKNKVITNIIDTTKWQGACFYLIFIAIFAIYYSFVQVNAPRISDNMKHSNQYIQGVKTGKSTENYIKKIVKHLSIFSACYLVIIIALPIIAQQLFNGPKSLIFGGTGLIIVVTVLLDILSQLKSMIFGTRYKPIL